MQYLQNVAHSRKWGRETDCGGWREKSQYLLEKRGTRERRKLICSEKISKTQLMGYSRERFELDNEIY